MTDEFMINQHFTLHKHTSSNLCISLSNSRSSVLLDQKTAKKSNNSIDGFCFEARTLLIDPQQIKINLTTVDTYW